jgi:hypothetical protein
MFAASEMRYEFLDGFAHRGHNEQSKVSIPRCTLRPYALLSWRAHR